MVLVDNLKLLDGHLQTTDMVPGLTDVAAYPGARAGVSLGTKHTVLLLLYEDNEKTAVLESVWFPRSDCGLIQEIMAERLLDSEQSEETIERERASRCVFMMKKELVDYCSLLLVLTSVIIIDFCGGLKWI